MATQCSRVERLARADDVLEDQVIWLQHCLMVEDAADAIRTALPFALAEFVPDIPGGLTVSTGAAALPDQPVGSSSAPAASPDSGEDPAPLALLERGRVARAARTLERAVGLDGTRPSSHLHLAIAYVQIDRPADALAEARRALALRPDYPQARGVVEALGRMGR